MSLYSYLFAATPHELAVNFPDRYCRKKELRKGNAVNPASGELIDVEGWIPVEPLAQSAPGLFAKEIKGLENLPHRRVDNVDLVMMCLLQHFLGLGEFDSLFTEMTRTQLEAPGAEDMIFPLPDAFRDALENLQNPSNLAQRLCATDEMQQCDALQMSSLLGALQAFARNASLNDRQLFYWMIG